MQFIGIPVSVNSSAVILFLITMTSGSAIVGNSSSLTLLALGGMVVTALLLFSLLFHERAHVWAAARYGIGCDGILIHGFGGFALLKNLPDSPGKYFIVAAAGPISSLVLAGLGKILEAKLPISGIAATSLSLFVSLNLVFAIFNCIPIFPLDGGRMLYAGLWKTLGNPAKARTRTTRIARILMLIILGLLIVGVFVGKIGTFTLIWYSFIGFMLWKMQEKGA